MSDSRIEAAVRDRDGKAWCLFIDRDGVINTRIMDGYVRSWEEFDFEPGALEAIASLSSWAPRVVIVTNQQGIGKGVMTMAQLAAIHDRMLESITAAGGRIDEVRFCPHLARVGCDCRKPNPGMALSYLAAHDELDQSLSVMVGDTDSDMEMARRLALATGGAISVRIDTTEDLSADATFASLSEFAGAVRSVRGGDRL
ncbi:HAD-IIIA family hydrolase [Herbiconiux sp. L3-i23]|uniref:D-glycero-alpha-D-manno-heptose-1,7-bisphosphate 7-phosphatase n=1 Tax=Herbiconiux sp. L3-i23 TaxID=2905871 RepID=UPI00205C2A4E|nr:HAD family hydrolase [Herbiconiux sp. L3-i23]BDI21620.1 D-glycero-alpha-D-manno-heptose-1,7-bisphosphate 7-phosphatase [Herbiconiux sp. L3-i23]